MPQTTVLQLRFAGRLPCYTTIHIPKATSSYSGRWARVCWERGMRACTHKIGKKKKNMPAL
jgi:hypothetical protein